MNDLRTAAQQALDAILDWRMTGGRNTKRLMPAYYSLRAALAEPVQKPLTEDEIDGLVIQHAGYGQDNFYAVTRAIERAHGIKECA